MPGRIMKILRKDHRIAVLIDAEGADPSELPSILRILLGYGYIFSKKAYGRWEPDDLRKWEYPLSGFAITLVQQLDFPRDRDFSKTAMIIDAMDMLHSGRYDAFALVTTDNNLVKLASRIKESQACVFGFGDDQMSAAFQNECDYFSSPREKEEDFSFRKKLPSHLWRDPRKDAAREEKPNVTTRPIRTIF